jgi:hypothetical protein
LARARRFSGELLGGHKGAAVEVPFDPEQTWKIASAPLWPGRRGHSVLATLDGVTFTGAIVPRSQRFYLMIPAEVQAQVGVALGDQVEIQVEPLSTTPVAPRTPTRRPATKGSRRKPRP